MIVGLDGATMSLIKQWAEEGKLPNLGRMMKEGVWGNLKSTQPYITSTAWSSFATGLNPGKHGIFDFYQHVRKTFDIYFTNSGVRRGKTLWQRLSEAGKKVCVINVPMTYPPEEVNGILVSGMDSPGLDSQFTYPGDVKEKLRSACGEYIIDIHFDEVLEKNTIELRHYHEFFKRLTAMVDNRCRATESLMETLPWDLLVTVFVAPDRSQHQFWKFMDATHPEHNPAEAAELGDVICKIYQACDTALGKLLAKIDNDTSVLIMSDHGAGPEHRVFYLRTWLQQKGFLVRQDKKQSGFNLKRGVITTLKRSFALGKKILPKPLKARLKSKIGRDKYIAMRLFFDVDWSKTTAYSEGVCGNIFINLKNREPEGIVDSPAEFERIIERISRELMKVKDPKTGEKVIKAVHRKEDLYTGELLEQAPDLLVEGNPGYHCRGDSFSREAAIGDEALFADAPMSGTHILNGAFLAMGPHFKQGHQVMDAEIIDILPTVLHLQGLPIPESIDGKVLTSALDNDFLKQKPIKKITESEDNSAGSAAQVYSAAEKAQIEERLKGLGYLE